MVDPRERSRFPVEGIEAWLELVEDALQGVQHSLSNRLGSLSALVELHQMGELAGDPRSLDAFGSEVHKLEECNRLVRLLGRDRGPGEEALLLTDVVADVLTIHRFLHDLRDTPVTVVPVRYMEPVRAERWAIVRVLTMLLADAKQLVARRGGAVQIVSKSDEQWVYVEFRAGEPAPNEELPVPGPYAASLAEAMGGAVHRKASSIELRLPTLKARRAAAGR